MIPKEKAEKLVQKYYIEVLYGNEADYSEKQLRVFKIKAKTCALIAVDLVLGFGIIENEPSTKLIHNFYLKVKQEIEAL